MKTSTTKTVTLWIMALAVVLALTASPAVGGAQAADTGPRHHAQGK